MEELKKKILETSEEMVGYYTIDLDDLFPILDKYEIETNHEIIRFIKDQSKPNQWFTTDDLPPKDDKTVLCINVDICQIPFIAYYDENSECFIPLHSQITMAAMVSHWMPLPKLPDNS